MTVPLYTGTLTRTGLAIVHPAQPEDVLQFAIKSGGSGELLLLSGKTGRARVNAARTEAMAFVGTVRITMALTRTRTGWDALETSYDGLGGYALTGETRVKASEPFGVGVAC